MRHRVYGKHLGRNKDERRTLFKGLVRSLLSYGTIQTSEARAKAIKGLIDKVINLAKDKNRYGQLESYITDKDLRERLIKEIIPKLGTRTSGFISTVKLGTRSGDQTMIVKMSLIGAEELKPLEKVSKVGKVSEVSKVKAATDKQKTEKPKSENRKQKTDNRKIKKLGSRRKK